MEIKEKIKSWVKETINPEWPIELVHPKDMKNGDYSFFNHSPKMENDFVQALSKNLIPEIREVKAAHGFINFYLSKEFFADAVKEVLKKGEKYGKNNLLKEEKIIIEHTQPNPFKEFHIGHLMNNAIGESVARILKSNDAEIKTASYHGDVGLHVAKTIFGMIRENVHTEVMMVLNDGLIDKETLKLIGKWYANGSQAYEENDENKSIVREINVIIYKIIAGEKTDDPREELIKNFYIAGKRISLFSFLSTYHLLDSNFDFDFYESESGEIGKEIVKKNVGKIFEESEGAVIFRGENFEPKTHTRVFLNKEGLPTYEAKEIGLAKIKREKWPDYTKSITVTANEQDSFFDVVEVAIGEVFPELKGKLTHLSHGMLKLSTGKMSSRTGNVITAESLIGEVKDKVLEKMGSREFDEKDPPSPKATSGQGKEEIAEIVAIGAIKYSILRQAIGGDIIFDFEKSISFEGDSGPYLQYTCVRANSVLGKVSDFAKATSDKVKKIEVPENWQTTELEKYLYRFPEIVERAGREYAPHYIVTYLTELASIFNSFYAQEKIIDDSDSSPYKIALTQSTAHILKNGLNLLGIKVPEKM